MATEKFFVFNEDGALKRLKGRIVRFLDNEDPSGADKSAIRTSLEVSPDAEGLVQADVGTAPNEIPVNGMLGDMAYQSSDGVSAAKLQVESTTGTSTTQALTVTDGTDTNFVVQEDGSVGVGTSSPSAAYKLDVSGDIHTDAILRMTRDGDFALYPGANNIVYQLEQAGSHLFKTNNSVVATIDASGKLTMASSGIKITGNATDSRSLAFTNAADTTGWSIGNGIIDASHNFRFYDNTAGAARWTIDGSNGNLVAHSTGIDFGSTNSTSGVTVTGSTMDHYEAGTWTPSFETSGSGFTNPPTMDVISARYVRIGDLVTFDCHIRTDSVDLTGAGTYLLVNGLPYAATASSGTNTVAVNVGYATAWANAPAGGYIQSGTAFMFLTKRSTSIQGNLAEMSPSDLTAGTAANQNILMLSGSYYTNA